MKKNLLFSACATLGAAAGLRDRKGHRGMETCEFYNPTSSQKAFKSLQRLRENEHEFSARNVDTIPIVVNLHAAVPSNASQEVVSGEQIYKQFERLREEYQPYGIDMTLGNITRTQNDELTKMEIEFDEEDALGGSTPEIEAFWKEKRTGDYKTLNIFIYQQMSNALGICNLPDEDREADTFYLDACHIVADSLPGSGTGGKWNNGGSAVHEVGHWFGLLHVWTDSCDDEGDLIHDTAQQIQPSMMGCANITDSCPGKPGKDNAHNFMDYSGDECQREFTRGQQDRMHHIFHEIRAKEKVNRT